MFVPNLGTCLCSHIIEKAVYGKKNLILKGSVGTGKSVAIKWALERLPQHSRVTLHVTKFLLSSKVSEFLEIKYQIQRKGEHD
jgi:predicted ATPase with chaperone activity